MKGRILLVKTIRLEVKFLLHEGLRFLFPPSAVIKILAMDNKEQKISILYFFRENQGDTLNTLHVLNEMKPNK